MSSPSIVQTRSLTRRSALGIVALALVMPSVSAFAQTPAILGACPGNGLGIKRSETSPETTVGRLKHFVPFE
jgi:hypothetical protein